jgi:hypothetical protein
MSIMCHRLLAYSCELLPHLLLSACFERLTITIEIDMRTHGWRPLEHADVRRDPGVLKDVARQLRDLLDLELTHCDLRFPNILYRQKSDVSRCCLVDLESLTCDTPPLRWNLSGRGLRQFLSRPALSKRRSRFNAAVWQLAVLLHDALTGHPEVERTELGAWLEISECKLLKLAYDAEFKDPNSPEGEDADLLEVAEASFPVLREMVPSIAGSDRAQ